jgi:hypothetical protein
LSEQKDSFGSRIRMRKGEVDQERFVKMDLTAVEVVVVAVVVVDWRPGWRTPSMVGLERPEEYERRYLVGPIGRLPSAKARGVGVSWVEARRERS